MTTICIRLLEEESRSTDVTHAITPSETIVRMTRIERVARWRTESNLHSAPLDLLLSNHTPNWELIKLAKLLRCVVNRYRARYS